MSTIFALGTARGKAGVAIMRISGPESATALAALGCNNVPMPRVATFVRLKNPETEQLIDEAIILWFPTPHSFTGEDVVELHLHGSHAVIDEVSRILIATEGLRIAEPGEFSRRAFENGKMDLTQAEGLADLIDAETSMQHRQALQIAQGGLKRQCDIWRENIISVLAQLEAYIDFPDEDLPEDLRESIAAQVKDIIADLQSHLENRAGEIVRNGVHIAIVGAPNAGKSSLLNVLAKRDVAIVSSEAGTTRDILEVHMDIGGYPVVLADTAGLRDEAGEVESEGIRRALARADDADITLCLFDASMLPELDKKTLAMVDKNSIFILSKRDLQEDGSLINNMVNKHGASVIAVDSSSDINVLLEVIEARVCSIFGCGEGVVFTRERHRVAIKECCERLKSFLSALSHGQPTELCAESTRQAAQSIGKITGHIAAEELLDNIFARFCIGK